MRMLRNLLLVTIVLLVNIDREQVESKVVLVVARDTHFTLLYCIDNLS